MAALDFPSGATTGTIFTGTNNVVYEFDGVKWIGQAGTAALDLSTVAQDIIPDVDNLRSLGSASKQWADLFVSTGTIFIGGVPITVNTANNTLLVGVQPGDTPTTATNVATESFVIEYVAANSGGTTAALPDITVPASTGTTYKGLQVSYGRIYSNSSGNELTVNKIVIHKPAITTTTIDPTSNDDDFKVDGLGSSDVLALFVLYGDTNGPKALSTLTTFAETIIDSVILDGGVEGQFNTVEDMKTAFYANYETISAAAGGLDADFQFYQSELWPSNSISDGGNDQYDGANYINSSFASQIGYNDGNTVADGVAAFGTGSSYTFVYTTGTFGLLVTGNNSTYIETSGNSGADGSSTTDSGNLYGPSTAAVTYDNAATHINMVSLAYAGPPVSFTKADNTNTVDVLIADDGAGAGVGITRNNNNGIYNPYREGSWDDTVSPGGTLWNVDGWNDLSDVESRTYLPLYAAFGYGGLGNKIVGAECVMYLPDNGKYYTVKFSSWTQGGGGGFAYTRRELNLDNLQEGIRFADGSILKSAEGVGRVKQTASGSRRIEEVYGTSQVSVTSRNTTNIVASASRAGNSTNQLWVDITQTTIDDVIDNPSNYNNAYDFEFSFDDITYYPYQGYSNDGNERGFGIPITVNYNQGDSIYFRYKSGGEPVVWWDKADLPGGSSNFRGAVIDYHAYSGEATWIGTIHIVDDSGEEHISHNEVGSGTTDSENDDLWLVQNEGTISYRRIDGESKTLKVQWSARVFYGSEFYD